MTLVDEEKRGQETYVCRYNLRRLDVLEEQFRGLEAE